MKHLLWTLLLALALTAAQAQQKINLQSERDGLEIITNTGITFSGRFSFTEISLQQINSPVDVFAEMSVPNFAFRFNDGNPSIPVFSQLIEIPGNAGVDIRVKSFSTQTINLSDYGIYDRIIPAQPSYSKSTDPNDIQFIFNEAAYLVNDFTQGTIMQIEYQSTARGVGIAQMIIDPIRYNPVTNQLLIYNNIEFEVVYQTNTYSQYLEEKDRVYSPYFNSFHNKLPNYIPPTTRDLITKYPVKYVIVAPQMFQDSLQKFVHWKTQKGFEVIEVYTNNPSVGTTTTSIKAYLQGLYNAGTPEDPPPTFILFVGDVAQIPVFNTTITSYNHITDMYYGEYTGGSDYIPEVYIGRFSATNLTQLMPQINKTLQYEKFTMPSAAYMDKAILVAGYDATYGPSHGNPQINYATNNYFNAAHGFNSWTVLAPNNTEAIAGASMRAELYLGFGFANYTAHCGSNGWGTPSFTTSHVPNMTNTDKYALMIGNCCLSNKFNDAECLGEAVLRVANKGAVGYIGGSNNTLWNEDYWWGIGMTSSIQSNPTYASTGLGAYDKVFHDHGEPYADWFITNAQVNYAGNAAVQASTSSQKKYYWEIYHLMGDPSVMNYMSVPPTLNMSYNSPLMVGDQQLVVNCEPYTLVAISQNNVLLDSRFSGANSSATLQFNALQTTGTVLIVGTKQDRAPHIQYLPVEDVSIPVDAQVMQIQGVQPSYNCFNVNISPKVILRNKGLNTLTQITLKYKWNNGTLNQIVWTGTLISMDTVHISLPQYTIVNGNNILQAYTTNPNGTSDGNTLNDTLIFTAVAQNNQLTADFAASVTEFCESPASVQFTNNSLNATSYYWDFGDGTFSTEESPLHEYSSLGLYTVSLTADAGVCGSEVISYPDMILVGADPPVANSATNCGPSSFILTASALADVRWYSDAAGTNLIHTGNSYTTPVLNNTTAYYLGTTIQNILFGAKPDNSGTGDYFTSSYEHGLIFNCSSPVILKSIKVYSSATSAQNKTIRLESSDSTLIQSVTVSVPTGESRITLNLNIPTGSGMRLMGPVSPYLFRNGGNNAPNLPYPYTVGSMVSITGSTASAPYYYFFYDWEVEEVCISPLTPVYAYVQTTPVSNFSYSSTGNTVSFTNLSGGGGGASYLWNFGNSNSSTLEHPVHTYSAPGYYNVTLQVTNDCGVHTSNQQVNILTTLTDELELPVVSIYPNPAQSICLIESDSEISMVCIYDLTGKLIYENEVNSIKTQINVSGLANGVYYLKIFTEHHLTTRLLMIE